MRFRQSLFWDVDPKTIDKKKHARYIIERILDFGNDKEVRWVWQTYSPRLLKDVITQSRVLHSKSRALWSLILQ
jgi:hypothetical protein